MKAHTQAFPSITRKTECGASLLLTRLNVRAAPFALFAVCALAGAISGQTVGSWGRLVVHGKVVMEDGSPPGKSAAIWRQCSDYPYPDLATVTDKNGAYTWPMPVDTVASRTCKLHAVLDPYQSSTIDITEVNAFSDPNLPELVLAPKGANTELEVFSEDIRVPSGDARIWNQAVTAVSKGAWEDAERQLRSLVKLDPKFARGWNALGLVSERRHESEEARAAYQQAVALDPKLVGAYLPLARLEIESKDWDAAAKTAAGLIKVDAQHYPEIYLDLAIARYHLQDIDGAKASVEDAIRLDKRRRFPRTEYILGLILETKQDYPAAGEHMSKYLELAPKTADADAVRTRIANLGKPEAGKETAPELELSALEAAPAGVGEAWVPGGMKALAAAAHIEGPVSYQSFFADYCRAIAREVSSSGTSQGIPGYIDSLRAYMASVSELLPLGEKRGDSTVITMSLASEAQRKQAEHVLTLLGWKLVQKSGSSKVEPGDQPADGLRQQIPALFGFDEIDMQEALEAGRSFQFEIPSENARLVGGDAWNGILKDLPMLPGGIAATFTTNLRVTKMYSGLGAMGPDAARAVLAVADLRTLVNRYADQLARYSEAFALTKNAAAKDRVAVPGGAEAEESWKKLTGVNPGNPPAFFRALLDKDQGRLAAFYYAVSRSDEAHRRFFTKTPARAERFYAWYRDSDEFRYGIIRQVPGWRTELFHDLPLDDVGNVRFPGGRLAWTSSTAPDDEILVSLKSLEALVPVSRLEQHRKAPLDQGSAMLLAQYYGEWSSLFPYFGDIPALGRPEFEALAAFAGAIGKFPPATQNLVLGEWYSLLELIARGVRAGSLDASAGSQAFRRVCEGLASPNYSARAFETLREIAGGAPDVNETVPAGLLRLGGAQRSAYNRVMELQNVPHLDAALSAADPAKTVAALSGFVYAASLDPDALLINEDPRVLSRHQFFAAETPAKRAVFSSSSLMGRNQAPGSYIRGGFANFEQIAHGLARAGGTVLRSLSPGPAEPVAPATSTTQIPDTSSAEAVFRVDGRLVEVWATVTDSRGRYMDDLTAEQFNVLEQQRKQQVVSFESRLTPVSVALLLDTTGSMQAALPALKNAAIKLMGDLRPGDSVAVYSFNNSVTELQPFTTDMAAAKRAVLHTQALGDTALYDALARVSRDLAGRPGKKVIVVFTDGNDNSSTLTTDIAVMRAKATGVPIYTIAQGEALQYPAFVKQLAEVSKATGGESFVIHEPNEIGAVFEKVSEDLTHGYLLTFAPPAAQDHSFHAIEVTLQAKGLKPRFREGYYPQ